MRIPEPFFRLTGQLHKRYLSQWTNGSRDVALPWNFENNAIFLHIPKTAGTSLLKTLNVEKHPNFLTHAPAEAYARIHPELWQSSFKFTFVRDPRDRLVSVFHFLRDGTNWPEQQRWADKNLKGLDFSEFMEKLRRDFLYRQIVMSQPFFWPQSAYLRQGTGPFGPKYAKMDAVYYFENLSQDVATLCGKLGIEHSALPHERKSARPETGSLFDARANTLVGQLYRRDYEMFDYDKPV